jgi:hypothetical protein
VQDGGPLSPDGSTMRTHIFRHLIVPPGPGPGPGLGSGGVGGVGFPFFFAAKSLSNVKGDKNPVKSPSSPSGPRPPVTVRVSRFVSSLITRSPILLAMKVSFPTSGGSISTLVLEEMMDS